MKKKLLSMLLVGATAMSLLAGCGGKSEEPKKEDAKTEATDKKEDKKELDVVNVAYMPNYASLWVVTTAKEKGYFEEQGIEVKYGEVGEFYFNIKRAHIFDIETEENITL